MDNKPYTNIKKTEEKNGEIEFSAEIPVPILESGMSAALVHNARNFEIPGFRKGKVPEHLVREHVDEMELLETAADEALRIAVKEIIDDEHLSILGSPQLTITKIAPKNPLAFKVRFALFPKVKLPDYKKIGHEIAERKNSVEVTEKDMDDAIERLRNMMAAQTGNTKSEAPFELTDEFAKTLGPFKDVAEFKAKLKESLTQEKELGTKEAKREEIIREIVKQSKAEIPGLLIDQEWHSFQQERDEQLKKAGLNLEEYLKQVNKTEKILEGEERSLIEERIKTSIVFREMQTKEAIQAEEKEIQTNIAYLKLRYPDRGEAWLRQTAEAVIIQEKIFDVLGLPIVSQ